MSRSWRWILSDRFFLTACREKPQSFKKRNSAGFIDGKRATVYENRRDANGNLISGRTVHIEATDKRVNMTLEPD